VTYNDYALSDPRRSALAAPSPPNFPVDFDQADPAFNLNVSWVFDSVRRGKWILLGAMVLALAAGLAVTLLTDPVYVAASSIHIEQQVPDTVTVSGDSSTQGAPRADFGRFAQTQIDLIQSRSTAREVLHQGRLLNNPLFLSASGLTGTGQTAAAAKNIEEKAISFLQRSIKVDLPKSTEIASIVASSHSPVLSAALANGFARAAVELDLKRQFDSSGYSREFLSRQLEMTKERLEASEMALNDYARQSGIVTANSGGTDGSQPTVTWTGLGEVSSAANAATAQRMAAQQLYETATHAPIMSVPQVLADSQVQGLQTQRAGAEAKLRQDTRTLGSDHPTVVQDRANLSSLKSELADAAHRVVASLRLQYESAAHQEASMVDRVQQFKNSALDEGRLGVRYNFLKRDVDTNRALYDALLQRQKEVSAAAGVGKSTVAVVDQAIPPRSPKSPSLFLNLSVALVIGLFVGVMIVLLREQMDQRLRTSEEISLAVGLPVLGVVPMIDGDASVIEELNRPRSPLAEAYFSARASLALARPEGLPATLLVTSSSESEGKSTTAYALALSAARLGKQTLLVDADLRRPTVHKLLELSNRVGLSDFLSSNVTADSIIQSSDTPNLSVVTSGPIPPSPTELLASTALDAFVTAARRNFDFIVIDSPPVLGIADALLLSVHVEGVVFVAESLSTTRSSLLKSLNRLRSVNARLLGLMLTKFVANRDDGYYYQYYYSYGDDNNQERLPIAIKSAK